MNYLDGENVAGGKMKECTVGNCPESEYWISPNTGATNESGFTGMPGGARFNGAFSAMDEYTYFWSSNESGDHHAWYQGLLARPEFAKEVAVSAPLRALTMGLHAVQSLSGQTLAKVAGL